MNVSSSHQIYVFSLFVVLGMVCGALFDVQRFLRKKSFAGNVRTTIEDTVFATAFIVIMLGASFALNNGEIRYYEVMGAVSGILFYAAFLSRIFLKILTLIFEVVEKLLVRPLVRTVLFLLSPIKKAALKIKRHFTKLQRRFKSVKKGAKKRRKIIKKRVKML